MNTTPVLTQPQPSRWKWLAITIALCAVAVTLLRECETDRTERTLTGQLASANQHVTSLRIDSGKLAAERNALRTDVAGLRLWAASAYDKLSNQLSGATVTTGKTPSKQQQKQVVRYYVSNKLIPADRLRDTVSVYVPDSTLVAAANTANLWVDIYKQQVDSLQLSTAAERQAAEKAELQADEEREARQDCQDENDQLKTQQKQQRKRNFWAVVKGVGAGVVSGLVAALVWLR